MSSASRMMMFGRFGFVPGAAVAGEARRPATRSAATMRVNMGGPFAVGEQGSPMSQIVQDPRSGVKENQLKGRADRSGRLPLRNGTRYAIAVESLSRRKDR